MKKKTKKKRIPAWPGPPLEPEYTKENAHHLANGEARLLNLYRSTNDRGLHAHEWILCCSCGLRHLYTFEVFRSPEGRYFMNMRSFADERTRPKKRRKK